MLEAGLEVEEHFRRQGVTKVPANDERAASYQNIGSGRVISLDDH